MIFRAIVLRTWTGSTLNGRRTGKPSESSCRCSMRSLKTR
jgi:hypothetical protein